MSNPSTTSEQAETGITVRHSRKCSFREGGECSCAPSYQAQVWSARDGKPIRRTFATPSKARRWRQEAQVDLRRRRLSAPSEVFFANEAEQWLAAARGGVVRTRSGEPYKPSALRSYEAALRKTLLPEFGKLRLSALTRARIQRLVDELVQAGYAPSTVCNAVLPLRAIYRRALEREVVATNPTLNLALPKERSRREGVVPPTEVSRLLDVLPPRHAPLWATAVYTGLRRGELQALRWETVDLSKGVLRVEHSWDRVEGLIQPKSRSGERTVPVPASLVQELVDHFERQGTGGTGFVFSVDGARPFDPPNAIRAARRAWARAGLTPMGFHRARHAYASFMIAAGVNAKALSTYMGHSSIVVTIDRYGHLMPGSEKEAAERLDRFLLEAGSARPVTANG